VLVGVATLLKHRLRYYNKLREIYLRRLEEKLCGGVTHLTNKPENTRETDRHPLKSKPPLQGPQGFMESGAPPAWFEASFHEVIDIYYFVYLFVWFVLYMSRAC
jgi:hypothetical protein